MKAKCVLVTGASGFIGHALVPALVSAGYVVRAVTRRPVSFPNVVEVVTIPDLKNSIDWAPILQGVDMIIHLAGMAHSHVPATEYSEVDQVNRTATQQLAQAAKNARVGRFVYISSVRAQIGTAATHPVSEQDEPHPTDLYGRTKFAAEQAVRGSGVPFTIFRPVVIYGPNPKGNMRTLVRFARLPVPLPIACFMGRRSLLGIDNLMSAIIFALNNPATVGETYLVADPEPMTIGEILTVLREKQGRTLTTIYIPQIIVRLLLTVCGRRELWSRFAGDLVVDTRKFKSLGWRPPMVTSEGLLEMMRIDDGDSASMLR